MANDNAAELISEKARETQIPEEQWRAAHEKLKAAEIGMTASEKKKVFCEAPTPQVVEDWIRQLQQEVAAQKPKIVGSPGAPRV